MGAIGQKVSTTRLMGETNYSKWKGHCDARVYGSLFVPNEQGSQ